MCHGEVRRVLLRSTAIRKLLSVFKRRKVIPNAPGVWEGKSTAGERLIRAVDTNRNASIERRPAI